MEKHIQALARSLLATINLSAQTASVTIPNLTRHPSSISVLADEVQHMRICLDQLSALIENVRHYDQQMALDFRAVV